MKRLLMIGLVLLPGLVFAQKPVKPNQGKALALWKQGKLDEAKEMIDLCATAEKLSLDGKTWYYKGLIYASIDTTSNPKYQALSSNALEVAMEAFEKAESMKKGNSEYYTTDQMGFPDIKTQQLDRLWGYYLNKGVEDYQYDDLDGAYSSFVKCTLIKPDDTTGYFYGSLAAELLEKNNEAFQLMTEYFKHGGNSLDGYQSIIRYHMGAEDNENALAAIQQAKRKYPSNRDLPKLEIDILIRTGKSDEAKTKLMDEIKAEPNNALLHFALGILNEKLNDIPAAKQNYADAVKVDPNYYDAAYNLAALYFNDALKIRNEMNKLGMTAADKKRAQELDKLLVEKYKETLPYWQKLEKLKGDECITLETLENIYYQLGMDREAKGMQQKIKMYACDAEE